jgi:hypothetical protein
MLQLELLAVAGAIASDMWPMAGQKLAIAVDDGWHVPVWQDAVVGAYLPHLAEMSPAPGGAPQQAGMQHSPHAAKTKLLPRHQTVNWQWVKEGDGYARHEAWPHFSACCLQGQQSPQRNRQWHPKDANLRRSCPA